MCSRRFLIGRLTPCVAVIGLLGLASPQDLYDRDAYAREHVRFLTLQLDQWSKEFPQQFYAALMQPPMDSSKLSPAAKASAGEAGDSFHKLASLASSKDILTSVDFRSQMDKTLAAAKELNQIMASQRFPAGLQSDWDQIRSTLNNLARVYKLDTLAYLEPSGAGGRGGRAAPGAAGLTGYIVDLACAKKGKGMWANTSCIERCIRDGEKIVLVTEEGKVYQISNQDKLTPETYGRVVTLIGKTEGETITVDTLRM